MPLVANSDGIINGVFSIPANVPVGTKAVEFQGSGGSFGSATYTATGTIITTTNQLTTTTVRNRYDPLAQTFTLPESRMIGAVDIKICKVGDPKKPVFVQIRETEVGIPNQSILSEAIIKMTSITAGNGWVRANFPVPVPLEGEVEYAIVILTDDAEHSVAIAKLGDYVQAGDGPKERWVTSQPYQIGALLASSNASTWTPINEADLTFRILACRFTSTLRTINLGTISAIPTTDLQVLANAIRTSSDTDVIFRITEMASATDYEVGEFHPLQLADRTSGTLRLVAELTGSQKMSPILLPGTQLLLGNVGAAGTYFTRAIDAAVTFSATVIFESRCPGTSTAVPRMEVQRVVDGVDVEDEAGNFLSDFVGLTLESRIPVGDGWNEDTWKAEGLRGVGLDRFTRLLINLTGVPGARPMVRQLRVIIK